MIKRKGSGQYKQMRVNIDPSVFKSTKARAALEGKTMAKYVEDILREKVEPSK